MDENKNRQNTPQEYNTAAPPSPPEIVAPAYPTPPVIERRAYRQSARRGLSTGTVIALLLGVMTIGLLAFYFITQNNEETHQQELQQAQAREAAAANKPAPPPVVIQQPAAPQPVVIQQPAAPPPVVIERSAPPVVINQPAPAPAPTLAREPDDSSIQTEVDKKLTKDAALSALGISAIVTDGKVTLMGSVTTPELKRRVESAVKNVRGVRVVDNQITVFNS